MNHGNNNYGGKPYQPKKFKAPQQPKVIFVPKDDKPQDQQPPQAYQPTSYPEEDRSYFKNQTYERNDYTEERKYNYENGYNRGDNYGERRDQREKKGGDGRGGGRNQNRRNNQNNNQQNNQNYKNRDQDNSSKYQRKKESSIKEPQNLREELIKSFEEDTIDCLICMEHIRGNHPIWSCGQCFAPFHLRCIHRLIESNANNAQPELNLVSWACPKCCYLYNDQKPQYFCFCKKYSNPESNHYALPHSCGNPCSKKRGPLCTHPCPLLCHPGPCPPCNNMGPMTYCYCSKGSMQFKCSENHKPYSCGGVCGKKLACGDHFCQELCHPGDCYPCPVRVEADCYCGKLSMSDVPCSQKHFSCHKPCLNTIDCGNHKCQKTCHPGACPDCQLKPSLVHTCPCGRTRLDATRKSCLDKIPTCGLPCRKKLDCGLHYCKQPCHEGPCDECQEEVDQICVCGAGKRVVQCSKRSEVFRCERVCKCTKSCGVHKCQNECCPAKTKKDLEHLCTKVCGKALKCGKHTCDSFCHLGNCQPCKVYINQPLSCSCGKNVKNPPLPCGTSPPSCDLPCSRQRPCGHQCPLRCHQDNCPPCIIEVSKGCLCGRNVIERVQCYKEALCTEPCNNKLPCGHFCKKVCHIGDCLPAGQSCTQKCGAKRKVCGHLCTSACHFGSPCPTTPCATTFKIKCECGNREAHVECGVVDHEIKQILKCNNSCANLKRFASLYENTTRKPFYPLFLARYAKLHPNFLKVEGKIENMLKNNEPNFHYELQNDKEKTLALEMLVTHHYALEIDLYLKTPVPFALVRNVPSAKIPAVKLSEYLKMIERNEVKLDVLPFEATINFTNISKIDSFEELENQLKEFKGKYYIERGKDRAIIAVHFWERSDCTKASEKLKKSYSYFSKFEIEENGKLQAEEEKEKDATEELNDLVIVSEKTIDDEKSGEKATEIVLDKMAEHKE